MESKLLIPTDPWRFYFADSIQYAADCWPGFRFYDILFSASTLGVTVITSNTTDGHVIFELQGRCFDENCSFRYTLERNALCKDKREDILALVERRYPPTKEPSRQTARSVAKALGLTYKVK